MFCSVMDCIQFFFFSSVHHTNTPKRKNTNQWEVTREAWVGDQVNTIRTGGLIRQRKDKLTQEEVGFKIKLGMNGENQEKIKEHTKLVNQNLMVTITLLGISFYFCKFKLHVLHYKYKNERQLHSMTTVKIKPKKKIVKWIDSQLFLSQLKCWRWKHKQQVV